MKEFLLHGFELYLLVSLSNSYIIYIIMLSRNTIKIQINF